MVGRPARDQFAALLPVMERVSGARHPDTLAVRANLAYYTGQAGNAPAARRQYAALLPVIESVLDTKHPDTRIVRANIAYWTRQPSVGSGSRIGRNDRCYCGSGLKFKRCHGDPRLRGR